MLRAFTCTPRPERPADVVIAALRAPSPQPLSRLRGRGAKTSSARSARSSFSDLKRRHGSASSTLTPNPSPDFVGEGRRHRARAPRAAPSPISGDVVTAALRAPSPQTPLPTSWERGEDIERALRAQLLLRSQATSSRQRFEHPHPQPLSRLRRRGAKTSSARSARSSFSDLTRRRHGSASSTLTPNPSPDFVGEGRRHRARAPRAAPSPISDDVVTAALRAPSPPIPLPTSWERGEDIERALRAQLLLRSQAGGDVTSLYMPAAAGRALLKSCSANEHPRTFQ